MGSKRHILYQAELAATTYVGGNNVIATNNHPLLDQADGKAQSLSSLLNEVCPLFLQSYLRRGNLSPKLALSLPLSCSPVPPYEMPADKLITNLKRVAGTSAFEPKSASIHMVDVLTKRDDTVVILFVN